jgi:hypothetical protein
VDLGFAPADARLSKEITRLILLIERIDSDEIADRLLLY